jgi:hypothetical protein
MSKKKQEQNKDEKEGRKRRTIKNQFDKMRKDNKTLSQKKAKRGVKKNFDKR